MTPLALPLVAAAAALFPEAQPFWAVAQGPQLQPTQVEVHARLVGEGRFLVVYQEDGYRFSALGEPDEAAQIAATISTFDDVIYPREVALFGPCPDADGNGKVILLITRHSPDPGIVLPVRRAAPGRGAALRISLQPGRDPLPRFRRTGEPRRLEHSRAGGDLPSPPPLQPRPGRDRVEHPAVQLHALHVRACARAAPVGGPGPRGPEPCPGGPLDWKGLVAPLRGVPAGQAGPGVPAGPDAAPRDGSDRSHSAAQAEGRAPDARRPHRRFRDGVLARRRQLSPMGASRSRPWCRRARCLQLGQPLPVRPPAWWRSASEGWPSSSSKETASAPSRSRFRATRPPAGSHAP